MYVGAELLREKVQALRLETNRYSLKSLSSGLRAWQLFSTVALGYHPRSTLPPRDDEHVAMWAATMANSGTAGNYISYLRWACLTYNLSPNWDTARLRQVLKGHRMFSLRTIGAAAQAKVA